MAVLLDDYFSSLTIVHDRVVDRNLEDVHGIQPFIQILFGNAGSFPVYCTE